MERNGDTDWVNYQVVVEGIGQVVRLNKTWLKLNTDCLPKGYARI